MTSAGVVVGAIIAVVFFTRSEVTIATLCDSFAILDASELRILHACRRVDTLDIFLLTLEANSGVEHIGRQHLGSTQDHRQIVVFLAKVLI